MPSSMIIFPEPASTVVEENTTFQITVQMINFVAGSFTNAQATYYSAPQELSGGKIVGHTRKYIPHYAHTPFFKDNILP